MCKICFEEIPPSSWLHLFNKKACVCSRCFRAFSPKFHEFSQNGISILAVYDYDETIREKLYQLKGCYDRELAPVFLSYFEQELKQRFKHFYLVPAPSWKGDDEQREFNHVEEIFGRLGLPFMNALLKTENVKQAGLNVTERQKVKTRLKVLSNVDVRGKRLLFVDDVLTTGATAQAAVEMLRLAGAKKVQILVMSKTQKPEAKV